jgi:hypothetical protein
MPGDLPPRPSMPTTVLSIGFDTVRLAMRNAVLASAGFRVVSASNHHDAIAAAFSSPPEVVVICHTVPLDQARRLAEDLGIVCPGVICVLLTEWDHEGFDDLREPEVLLAHVASLTQTPLPKLGSAAEAARRTA